MHWWEGSYHPSKCSGGLTATGKNRRDMCHCRTGWPDSFGDDTPWHVEARCWHINIRKQLDTMILVISIMVCLSSGCYKTLHRLCGLKSSYWFLLVLETVSSRSVCQYWWVLGQNSSWFTDGCFLAVSSMVEMVRGALMIFIVMVVKQ